MPHDAHPMGVLVSAMSALSVFHPDANPALRVSLQMHNFGLLEYINPYVFCGFLMIGLQILLLVQGQDLYKLKQVRDKQIARILGKVCPPPIFDFYFLYTGQLTYCLFVR